MKSIRTARSIPVGRRGFTLIEILIVVAIIAIVAAVALPSYFQSVRKSRRAEAVTAMAAIQQAQERWRANNTTYAANSVLTTAAPSGLGQLGTTPNGRYTLSISNNTATQYTVTATAVAAGGQTNDKSGSTTCSPLVITVNQASTTNINTYTPDVCWSK